MKNTFAFLFYFLLISINSFSQEDVNPRHIPLYGKPIEIFEPTYTDGEGKPKKIIKTDSYLKYKEIYFFDKKANLLEVKGYRKDTLNYTILNSYNKNGLIISHKVIGANGDIKDSISYTYDSQGRIKKEKRLKFNSIKKYEYQTDNKTVKVFKFENEKKASTTTLVYNNQGKLVSEHIKTKNSFTSSKNIFSKNHLVKNIYKSNYLKENILNYVVETTFLKNGRSKKSTKRFTKNAGKYYDKIPPKTQEYIYDNKKKPTKFKVLENENVLRDLSIEYDKQGNYIKVINNLHSSILTREIEYY